jgi:hypothetical protein
MVFRFLRLLIEEFFPILDRFLTVKTRHADDFYVVVMDEGRNEFVKFRDE